MERIKPTSLTCTSKIQRSFCFIRLTQRIILLQTKDKNFTQSTTSYPAFSYCFIRTSILYECLNQTYDNNALLVAAQMLINTLIYLDNNSVYELFICDKRFMNVFEHFTT